ncbi:MAG: queuosine precursor transporter [Bacteroidia bacterium]|nr:queuosine precursor transporter [Bacteroidia bacterium]
MQTDIYKKENLLFIILGGFFVTNALIAEVIGSKIFSLEKTLGFQPVDWSFFFQEHLSFTHTAGVIMWPVVFIMTDIINEYYGKKGVKFLSYLTVGLIIYAFLMIYMAIHTVPADFWLGIHPDIKPDINVAFERVFNQGLWIIIGSIAAFLIGQLLDVIVFQQIRKITAGKYIWLRATGSTLISQLVDSFVVLFIAFYIGPESSQKWAIAQIFAVGTMNYLYKFMLALFLTPVIYMVHYLIEMYLGTALSAHLKEKAAQEG